MERRVVVTGCGVVSSVGTGKAPFWESVVAGKSGIAKITAFDPSAFTTHIAGEVKDFVSPSCLHPKEARRTSRFIQFALAAAQEAILESKIDIKQMDPYRAGCIYGVGMGSMQIFEEEHNVYLQKGPSRISPFLIPMMITNEAPGHIGIMFGLKGVNYCTVTACASGAHSIGESYLAIKHNRADVILAGGAEACITPMGIGGFCAIKALSRRNDEPTRASRPFDKERDGFVMAEGAGAIVLEELEHAKKRGAHIYGEVCGYGATCDAFHITSPDPEANAAAKTIELALEGSGIDINHPVYINAHGTSTELNDKIETLAIKKVFKEKSANAYVNSTKSIIGHTLGAAGAIEFIVCCLTLKDKVIHPTINYENPDPECDLNYVPNKAIKLDVKACLSNSLGFGGHNATLALKEYK
jgi:3-oxoacyl-[acyl-carrier-protein] synthase II